MLESRGRRRRRWSVEFKRQVVAEASAPGVSVAAVARRYDLNANLVFNWRRRYGGGGVFLPVAISEPARPTPGVTERTSERVAGEIEVALPSGHRVRIRGGFDPELVTRLLRGLSS